MFKNTYFMSRKTDFILYDVKVCRTFWKFRIARSMNDEKRSSPKISVSK